MRIDDRALDLPAEQVARLLALGLLEEASAAAEALAGGSGNDALHDFRVALRRLRTVLRALRPWLGDAVRRRQEKRLKRLARSTNGARDAEVQLAWLAAQRVRMRSPRLRPGYAALLARFERRARSGPDTARVAARFGRAAAKLERRLARPPRGPPSDGAPFGHVLGSLVREQVPVLARGLDAIRSAGDTVAVHRARIETKRLRYLLEPLRGARAAVGRLKRLQGVLGELHDAHLLEGELRSALEDGVPDGGRAGVLALIRAIPKRREALYADLERERRAGGLSAVAVGTGALAAGVDRAVAAPAVAGARGHASPRLDAIPARAEGGFQVVVETPRGAAFKLKLEPALGVLTLKRPLPLGFTWPYDFGFVPSTRAPDGDPVDALVFWDAATPAGTVVPCRALGVLQLDQDENGHRVRNDRIIAVPLRFERGEALRRIADLPARVRDELAHFATSSVFFEERDVRVLGWAGPEAADALIDGER